MLAFFVYYRSVNTKREFYDKAICFFLDVVKEYSLTAHI